MFTEANGIQRIVPFVRLVGQMSAIITLISILFFNIVLYRKRIPPSFNRTCGRFADDAVTVFFCEIAGMPFMPSLSA